MKKETVVKNITKLHTALIEDAHKLRDLVYSVEDDSLCEQVDQWCEDFEGYMDEDGSVDKLVESTEEAFESFVEDVE